MENNQLPAETQERIKADAVKTASDLNMKGRNAYEIGWEAGYIAGSTAENLSFEPILKAAEKVAKIFAHDPYSGDCAICQLAKALQQWKGKEVENE